MNVPCIWGGSLRGLSAGLKNQTVWVRLPPAPPKDIHSKVSTKKNFSSIGRAPGLKLGCSWFNSNKLFFYVLLYGGIF